MQLTDIIDINLLNRFLTNLRSLFATKSEVAAKQDALMYNATSGTSGTAAATAKPYYATRWRVDLSNQVTELYSGLTILFKIPVAGNGTYGTLLRIDGTTAADDSSSNLYPVCANVNSMISTRYAVGCIIALTFDASQVGQTLYYNSNSAYTTAANGTGWTKPGCWKVSDYDTNTTTTYGTLDYYFRPYTGTRLTPYKIVALDKDNRVIPITTEQYCGTYGSTTSYVVDDIVVYDSVYYKCITAGKGKTPSTSTSYWQTYTMPTQFTPTATPFRPEKLRFYGSSTLLAAGAATGGQSLTEIGYNTSVCTYTFWATISSYRVIYLQGTYDKTTGLFTLDTGANYYKLAPCNTANLTLSSYFTSGKYYILLGSTYSSNNYFQLFMVNTMYYFDGTNLIPYESKLIDDVAVGAVPTSRTINGKALSSDISLSASDVGALPSNTSVGDSNVIESIKVNNTPLSISDKAVNISLPIISTSISNDASSDTKTVSPKAVKSYVDGKFYAS